MSKPGKLKTSEAAALLDVHPNTIRKWARNAIDGQTSLLSRSTKHALTGHLSIDVADIEEIKEKIAKKDATY